MTFSRQSPAIATHRSINFVTCHDGFTLADLVSYNEKHNLRPMARTIATALTRILLELRRRGTDRRPAILALRHRQMKNLLTLLLVARGTPMLLGGDEFGRTQRGNNNAYCQDNEISWFDWDLLDEHSDIHRLVRELIALRQAHPTLHTSMRLGSRPYREALSDGVRFHGVSVNSPDWGYYSHSLGICFEGIRGDVAFDIIANAFTEELEFELPRGIRWARVVDTSLPTPEDVTTRAPVPVDSATYTVAPRSVVVLIERR